MNFYGLLLVSVIALSVNSAATPNPSASLDQVSNNTLTSIKEAIEIKDEEISPLLGEASNLGDEEGAKANQTGQNPPLKPNNQIEDSVHSNFLKDGHHLNSESVLSRAADALKADDRSKQMLCGVNIIRRRNGKPDLKLDDRLMRSAQLHSEDQAAHKKMTHVGTQIPNFGDRIKKQGYQFRGAAENIAWNQKTIAEVISSWEKSPGHFKNMIGDYKCFGWGEKDLYWTQNIASGAECKSSQIIKC